MDHKNSVHITFQGQGGVGKTLIAWILAQYLAASPKNVAMFDLNPVCPTFFRYKGLGPVLVQSIQNGGLANGDALDNLIEQKILTTDKPVVIDTGPGSYLAFANYLHESNVLGLLEAQGKHVVLHVPITADTIDASHFGPRWLLELLASDKPRAILWANKFYGPIRNMEDCLLIREHAHKLLGVMHLGKLPSELLAVTHALSTIAESLVMPSSVPEEGKQRLATQRDELFSALDGLFNHPRRAVLW